MVNWIENISKEKHLTNLQSLSAINKNIFLKIQKINTQYQRNYFHTKFILFFTFIFILQQFNVLKCQGDFFRRIFLGALYCVFEIIVVRTNYLRSFFLKIFQLFIHIERVNGRDEGCCGYVHGIRINVFGFPILKQSRKYYPWHPRIFRGQEWILRKSQHLCPIRSFPWKNSIARIFLLLFVAFSIIINY